MDEPWPDDILAVTCMRADRAESIVPGSLVKTCWRCECSIWVSPATLEHVRTQQHRFLCMDCMMVIAAKDESADLAPVTPAQMEELKQALEAKGLPIPTAEELEQMKADLQAQGLFGHPPAKKRF